MSREVIEFGIKIKTNSLEYCKIVTEMLSFWPSHLDGRIEQSIIVSLDKISTSKDRLISHLAPLSPVDSATLFPRVTGLFPTLSILGTHPLHLSHIWAALHQVPLWPCLFPWQWRPYGELPLYNDRARSLYLSLVFHATLTLCLSRFDGVSLWQRQWDGIIN